jgi:tetratricopeptide (TPR) repeat protein
MKTRHLVLGLAAGFLGVGVLMVGSYLLAGWFFPSSAKSGIRPAPPPSEVEAPLPPSALTAEAYAFHRNHQYSNAIASFEACIKQYPEFSDAYHGLAQSLRESGDPAKAVASHDRAIELDPNRFDLYWERGATYLRMKDYDHAITNFQACLERNGNFATAQHGLGEAYRGKGDFKEALVHHDAAIAMNPGSAWFLRERGNTYRKMGDKERADADLARAKELDGGK